MEVVAHGSLDELQRAEKELRRARQLRMDMLAIATDVGLTRPVIQSPANGGASDRTRTGIR